MVILLPKDTDASSANAVLAILTALVLAAALSAWAYLAVRTQGTEEPFPEWGHEAAFSPLLRAEPGALIISGIALVLALLVAIYSGRYLALDRRHETYYPLLLLLVAGLNGMVLAVDLFNLYMFCELMSLAAYALVAFRRRSASAVEAGFKYLIMGSVGTIVLLIGISFVYRTRGRLDLPPIPGLATRISGGTYARLGLACVMVGLAVKSAIVPLHTWLPDAHGRAPSSISAMLSGIIIQSTFYVGLKVSLGLGFPRRSLGTVLILLSLLNMTLGNGMALVQNSAKRLLAYSTIAQMGYVMLSIGIGLRYKSALAIQAGFLLLLAHAVMKGLAFLSKGACSFYDEADTVTQLRGTSQRLRLVAVTFTLALAGLVGVPPLAGFSAKWFVLLQALRAATTRVPVRPPPALIYVGLAFFVLNNLVSLGYFLPLIGALFSSPVGPQARREGRRRVSIWMALPLVILSALVIAIGVYPGPWLQWIAGISAYLMRI